MHNDASIDPVCEQRAAYRRLLSFAKGLGVVTLVGGVLWLVFGAGICGSPVEGAFGVNPDSAVPDYEAFWAFLIVLAGPIMILPCALIERSDPHRGAGVMIFAAIFVAEAGIRASRMFWGFSGENAQIVIGCISTPMLLLGVALLATSAHYIRWQAVTIGLLAAMALVVGLTKRYKMAKTYWDANCPAKVRTR